MSEKIKRRQERHKKRRKKNSGCKRVGKIGKRSDTTWEKKRGISRKEIESKK